MTKNKLCTLFIEQQNEFCYVTNPSSFDAFCFVKKPKKNKNEQYNTTKVDGDLTSLRMRNNTATRVHGRTSPV